MQKYGTIDNREVVAYTLKNNVLRAQILTYGATLDALYVPDRHGVSENILLTFGSLEERCAKSNYQGETVGRYANRIGGAKFTLNGRDYALTENAPDVCLHGGGEFSHAIWDVLECDDKSITLAYTSLDGANGFPGTVRAQAQYTLEGSALHIDYTAVSNADTILSMTNHAYFNFAGVGDILSHVLQIQADAYLPMNDLKLPSGEIRPVAGTEFDFRSPRPIEKGTYDHNFCLSGSPAATVYEPTSGRAMELRTNQPGVQLYVGGGLPVPNAGFCLETQAWPNSPNQRWPGSDCTLRAGEHYHASTSFLFSVR